MKKIILMLIAVLGIIFIIPSGVHAVDDVIFLETKISGNNILYGQTNLTINEVIINNEAINDDKTLISIIPNEQTASVLYDTWYYNVKVIMIWYQGDYVFISLYDTLNNFLDEIIIYYPNVTLTSFTLVPHLSDYEGAYNDGYSNARREYGYRDGNNYITADDYGLSRYNTGLDENREYYGYFNGTNWVTAEQWGNIEYYRGYELGLTNEIDWFSWAFTFITMPVRILNVEVLPNIKIGYFALFTLMTGIISWFFFIVGKGKGKK